MKIAQPLFFLLFLFLLCLGCDRDYTPKPYGFFRIDFPEKTYQTLNDTLPYTFDFSDNAYIEVDNSYDAEPYWINIVYPDYNAMINISYKYFQEDSSFMSLLQDSHHLAYAHTSKADAIQERYYENKEKGLIGVIYLIKGNAASSSQFFITDSTKHFLRGALYIHQRPNADSLAPVIEYLQKDIIVFMETLTFK